MSVPKYEIVRSDSIRVFVGLFGRRTLYRIRALRDFGDVKKGDLGGYIESYFNLSQEGLCWVYDEARVYDRARVTGDAKMFDNSMAYENAILAGSAEAHDSVRVYGSATLCRKAKVFGYARIYGNAVVDVDTRRKL